MNRRTWHKYHVGHVNITVQLDSTAPSAQVVRNQELARIARDLIAAADAARIPATWAVSDPAHSAATSLIIRSATEHELEILGDVNWVGPTAGRTRFARELVRRITQARGTGIQVTTFVSSVADVADQIDLVVKQQITAIAGTAATAGTRQQFNPHALHYGLWELPITGTLPMAASWFSSAKRTLWKRIRRAATEAGGFHLMIDAAAIAESGLREESAASWLLNRVATLRDRGLIRVETMRTTAARLSDVPAVSPQRSILRAA